jgi:hypothetical protein
MLRGCCHKSHKKFSNRVGSWIGGGKVGKISENYLKQGLVLPTKIPRKII